MFSNSQKRIFEQKSFKQNGTQQPKTQEQIKKEVIT
jgi:hypothetical protein